MPLFPDMVSVGGLIAESGSILGRPLHLLDETTSTNDVAKEGARDGAPHGSTWFAETQTKGRGRQGRSWIGERGTALQFSVLVRRNVPIVQASVSPIVTGLVVAEVVARKTGRADVGLKWPNDVLIGGKKVAGILVESSAAQGKVSWLVIGIGINVLTRKFPDDLQSRATSIALSCSRPSDRAQLLAEILVGLDRELEHAMARGLGLLSHRVAALDCLHGKRVRAEGGAEGIAMGIDRDGALRVQEADGVIRAWTAGEVHLATLQ